MKFTYSDPGSPFRYIVNEKEHPEMGASVALLSLRKGVSYGFSTGECEYIILLYSGSVRIGSDTLVRSDPFCESPVFAHYPAGSSITAETYSDSELILIFTGNAEQFEPAVIVSDGELVGHDILEGRTERLKRPLFDERQRPQSILFCGELITHQGSWACYPPHKHDEPEIYFYRFSPRGGYAFVEDGDTVHRIEENDAVGVINRDNHSQVTAPGFSGYILWVQKLKAHGCPIKYSLDDRYSFLG